ncbi:hypothetical protein TNCV_2849481 [Trichonephila clavipes]|nr:hypothetical protein TNCV_2849481 [Trichonephila clavipes]
MRRGHLRHIDIQSENCRQLYTPQHLSEKKQYTPQLFSRNPIVTRGEIYVRVNIGAHSPVGLKSPILE